MRGVDRGTVYTSEHLSKGTPSNLWNLLTDTSWSKKRHRREVTRRRWVGVGVLHITSLKSGVSHTERDDGPVKKRSSVFVRSFIGIMC